ncbi:hypothetical protein [Winogradskyella ursingii]|uniref:hypothetical protein n=1 Tax=Winogradskyella ursingii TaxID=2686079 RepID=UPI0015CCA59B|nr:hypothetical protein [Winogradskyella ursingii]
MIAKLEDKRTTIYNEQNAPMGTIKTGSDYKRGEIVSGKENYQFSRNNRITTVSDNEKVIYSLKANWFSGNIEFLEVERRITGVFGIKWGTQMVDNQNNSLVKIRNKNQFIDEHTYVIETCHKNVTNLES